MSLRVNKSTAKLAFKGIGRQVEKMKLGFGMVEQTKDDNLAFLVDKYFQHQQGSTRFLKSLREYYECQKTLHAAHLQLQSSMIYFYDIDWVNRDELLENLAQFSFLYEEYISKVSDRIIDPFTQYLSRFPYYKDKLDKRGRKLLDYDSCKREVETLQTKILRNKDGKDPKLLLRLTTLENEFQNTKEQYDKITDELYEDLTLLINNRVVFSAKLLEYFFQAQVSLFQDTKVLALSSYDCSNHLHERGMDHFYDLDVSRDSSDSGIEKISAILSEDNCQDFPMPARNRFSAFEKGGMILINPGKWKTPKQISVDYYPVDHSVRHTHDTNHSESVVDSPVLSIKSEDINSSNPEQSDYFIENMVIVPTSPIRGEIPQKYSFDSAILQLNSPRPKKPSRPHSFSYDVSFELDEETLRKLPIATSFLSDTETLPEEDQALIQLQRLKRERTLSILNNIPDILYRVLALFDYFSEDPDELNFNKGEYISVILDSSSEIDEGWLMGRHEQTNKKGIFPANHTTLI